MAKALAERASTIGSAPAIIEHLRGASGDQLQAIVDALKQHGFKGVAVLAGDSEGAVALIASVGSEFTTNLQAGKIIQAIAPIVGGKGGGRPDNARGAGRVVGKIPEALAHARSLLS